MTIVTSGVNQVVIFVIPKQDRQLKYVPVKIVCSVVNQVVKPVNN